MGGSKRGEPPGTRSSLLIRALTCVMFLMFAMTSDAVGSVIPKLIEEFRLNMKAAGAFHYAPMGAIAAAAILLGFLADRIGRKRTIILGLAFYGASSLSFAFSDSFGVFVGLLIVSGIGVSIFKIGALALIGDISTSSARHTATMNLVEGFFGIGSILGPAVVAILFAAGLSWKWLYVIAAGICGVLILMAGAAHYPDRRTGTEAPADFARTLVLIRDPYTLFFSGLIMLYVAVEVAIYVWMPTYLRAYHGSAAWLVPYALTVFFVLRAAGRIVGAWMLGRTSWSAVLALLSLAIFICFAGSLMGGPAVGVFLLPLSGLFMSVLYPTLNSKGISCFPKSEHGSVAGIILFFTAAAAALGPFAMAAASDAYGDPKYGFVLAAGLALLLFLGLLLNGVVKPAERRLQDSERAQYA
jgi:MFS transporter, DHA1 family, quinolone resistance protein